MLTRPDRESPPLFAAELEARLPPRAGDPGRGRSRAAAASLAARSAAGPAVLFWRAAWWMRHAASLQPELEAAPAREVCPCLTRSVAAPQDTKQGAKSSKGILSLAWPDCVSLSRLQSGPHYLCEAPVSPGSAAGRLPRSLCARFVCVCSMRPDPLPCHKLSAGATQAKAVIGALSGPNAQFLRYRHHVMLDKWWVVTNREAQAARSRSAPWCGRFPGVDHLSRTGGSRALRRAGRPGLAHKR